MDAPSPKDRRKKVENETRTGALAGLGIGAGLGLIIGGIAGGGLGALIGLGVGALVGAGIGALIGWGVGRGQGSGAAVAAPARTPIAWADANYTADTAATASTTVEQEFVMGYNAVSDPAANVWRLQVTSIGGGADIAVHNSSRDPFATPPVSEAEAQAAVTNMKGYHARGRRGAWHTEAASRAHEEHHYREWKCSADHYWGLAQPPIETLTAPVASHANAAGAVAAMRAGAAGADARVQAFKAKSHDYWFTLADNASSRPYAAGQLALNTAITHVQGLASANSWTVPAGVDTPDPEPPCYQPWLAFSP